MSQTKHILENFAHGAAEVRESDQSWHLARLPKKYSKFHANSPVLELCETDGSGTRLRFRTNATLIHFEFRVRRAGVGPSTTPIVFDYFVDGVAHKHEILSGWDSINFVSQVFEPGETLVWNLQLPQSETLKQVEIWLPHSAKTSFEVIEANGEMLTWEDPRPIWAHYGSSISQCNEADSPIGVWPVAASKRLDLNLSSLGLAGSAVLDYFLADELVARNPKYISLKVGINSVNGAAHSNRSFVPAVYNFLKIIRQELPRTPILLCSPIFCPPHEEGIGPTLFDMTTGKALASEPQKGFMQTGLNLEYIRTAIEGIWQNLHQQDDMIFYLNGLDLFSENDAHLLPDDLHPNTEGYALMADRFVEHSSVRDWLLAGERLL